MTKIQYPPPPPPSPHWLVQTFKPDSQTCFAVLHSFLLLADDVVDNGVEQGETRLELSVAFRRHHC